MAGRNILVVVTGPTASGKTSLAIELANRYGTDVVSADSRQIYKDIPIGTAAPSDEECARAFHHFVGTLPLDAYYSAACYEKDALEVLERLWTRSRVAVVCGGSMMYVDALCNGIDEMPTVSDSTRKYVLALLDQYGIEGVLAQLKIVDPNHYEIVDKANTRRIVHALEVSFQAGVPYSSLRTGRAKERPFEILKFAIERPREELFERINRRVDSMVEKGLIEEARAALSQGVFNSLNTVGYKELAAYFRGEWDLATAVARIGKDTRVYAKKQMTWLARDKSVIWLKPEVAFADACRIIDARINAEF